MKTVSFRLEKMESTGNDAEQVAASNADKESESIENELQVSSYDPEKSEPVKEEGGSDEWMNLTLLPLLLLLLALQFSCLLSEQVIDRDDGTAASASIVASMTLGIVAMATLFQQIYAGKVHLRSNTRQNVQVNAILRDNLSLVGIMFFCPFACLLDIFQIFAEISCGQSWKVANSYKFYVLDVTFCVLHVIFMSMELLFCVQFRRLVMKKNVSKLRRFCVKLSLTIVVASNIGLWFNVVLQETMHTWASEPTSNDTVDAYEGCLLSTYDSVEETVRRSLYPFSVEFSLLVLEFFVSHLIFNKRHSEEHETEVDRTPSLEDLPPDFEDLSSDSEDLPPGFDNLSQTVNDRRSSLRSIVNSRQRFLFTATCPLVIIFGVVSNLLSIAFSFFSREEIFGDQVLQQTVIRNQQFFVFYWLLLLLLMTAGFASAATLKPSKNKLKGIDYVVIVSAFGPFICFLIRIIVVIENYDIVRSFYEPSIIWLPELLNLAQVMVQLPFMFFADGIQRPSAEEGQKPRWRVFKVAVLSVALCNITLWLLDSVLLNIDIVASIFPESRWTIIDGIFRPFSIFFRFNSFLILLRAFLR